MHLLFAFMLSEEARRSKHLCYPRKHVEASTITAFPLKSHQRIIKCLSTCQTENRFQHFDEDERRPNLQRRSNEIQTKPKPHPWKSNSRRRSAHFRWSRSRLHIRSENTGQTNENVSNKVGETTRLGHSRKRTLCSSKHTEQKQHPSKNCLTILCKTWPPKAKA